VDVSVPAAASPNAEILATTCAPAARSLALNRSHRQADPGRSEGDVVKDRAGHDTTTHSDAKVLAACGTSSTDPLSE